MGWQDLLSSGERVILPWLGGRKIYSRDRSWNISGKLPQEYGWYEFEVSNNRKASLVGEAEIPDRFEDDRRLIKGYLAGDRMVPDDARVDSDSTKLVGQTVKVWLVERGLERFARAVAAETMDGKLVYIRQEFPKGSETEVQVAYQDREESVAHVVDVTPALDLTFRWMSRQRILAEERAREAERRRVEEEEKARRAEKLRKVMRDASTSAGRRVLAVSDFDAAAKAALRLSGAQLLDTRESYGQNEMVVQYLFRNHRFECVVDRRTLRVVDSGVCLTSEETGEKGDTYFTLESLPSVIGQAIDEDVLVIYRHVD